VPLNTIIALSTSRVYASLSDAHVMAPGRLAHSLLEGCDSPDQPRQGLAEFGHLCSQHRILGIGATLGAFKPSLDPCD
jgi:hypothetical protein